MRRLAPALLVLAALLADASAKDENLVENGGFEKGLDGWTELDETGTLEVEVDRKERAKGRASAHLVKPPAERIANDRLQVLIDRVPAGKTIAISARLKGKALQNTWLKLFVFDREGDVLVEDCDIGRYTGTFGWRDVERTFEIPREAVRAELRLCMFLGGEAWLDEVRVVGDASAQKAAVTGESRAEPLDDQTRRWLDDYGVRIATLDFDAAFEDLEPLREVLADARIVQLGENTHGDGACFEAKARLVRFLHQELGFDVLAFESGLYECDRANELLRRGDAEGAMRGSVFGIWHTKPVRTLFDYLKGQADRERPLHLAGFDCRRSGRLAGGFVDALGEFLAPTRGTAREDLDALRRLESQMDEQGDSYRPTEGDLAAALAAHERLAAALDDGREALVRVHGEQEVAFFAHCLANWKANERFERSKSEEGQREHGSTSLRDQKMAENLRWLAEVRHPEKKIITWGATFHLVRGLRGVSVDGNARHYEGCRNMGEGTHETFGEAVYTIGFAAHGGQFGSFGRRNPVPAPRHGSVEDVLHRYGAPLLFVDLRRPGPFAEPMYMAPMSYSRAMQARWPDVLDAVLFIDEMTHAR